MTYDGRDYQTTVLVPPYASHSKAPLTPQAFKSTLTNVYVCARYSARTLFQQPYNWTARNPATQATNGTVFAHTNYVDIGEGYRGVLPIHTNWIVARVVFGVFAIQPTWAFHKITVTDGTDTDAGTAVRTDVPPNGTPVLHASLGVLKRNPFEPFAALLGINEAICEVQLADVSPGVNVKVTVSAYARGVTNGAAQSYLPQFISCWSEVRG